MRRRGLPWQASTVLLQYLSKGEIMDIQKMIKEAQAMQKNLMQAQADLEKIEVQGSSGGGLIEITMTGQGELKGIKIKKETLENDSETVEDLIMAAFKDAHDKATSISKEKLSKLTGGKSPFPF